MNPCETCNVRRVLVVFGQSLQSSSILRHPFLDDERSRAHQILLHPILSHRVIRIFAIDARPLAILTDSIFQVEGANHHAFCCVHPESVFIYDGCQTK